MLIIEKVLAKEAGKEQPVRIDTEASEMLDKYSWPGNIRQLCNVLRYACAVNETGTIGLIDLPPDIIQSSTLTKSLLIEASAGKDAAMPSNSLKYAENIAMKNALRKQKWNISEAAKDLGISRATMYRKMDKYQIIPPNKL
jgi:transcriptional regulator of acetoin/glycerol metabolism